jgi:2-hydroxy-6-oxonona-2,4-dienedioate hydrolase
VRLIRYVSFGLLGLVAVGVFIMWSTYESDMRTAREALSDRSKIAHTAVGPIEYADAGAGRPLLTIHGAGGGFDRGLDNGVAMMGQGFRLISPSRFGYLRTPVPPDASPSSQAHAHIALLDALDIEKAIILGVSAGTRSALELGLRHPERVSALILVVPATYFPGMTSLDTERKADFPLILWLVNNGADLAWWTLEHVAPNALIRFVGVPPEVVRAAAPEDQEAVIQMVRSIEPLSKRFAGIKIDSQPDLVPRSLETINVPTLIITARDDLFNTYPSAEYTASQIPGAKLIVYDEGGHLLVGHGEKVRTAIAAFLTTVNLGRAAPL